MKPKRYILKFLTSIIVVSFMFSGVFITHLPQEVRAQGFVPVYDAANFGVNSTISATTASIFGVNSMSYTSWNLKEWVGGFDMAAWIIGKEIINHVIVEELINWVVSEAFGGESAFLTNPKDFFTKLADIVAGDIIEELVPFLCEPIKFPVQEALEIKHGTTYEKTYQTKHGCTLSDVIENIETFYEDYVKGGNFYQGGWEGLFVLSQNPDNNPYGAYINANTSVADGISAASGLATQELDWNSGFFGSRTGDGSINTPGSLIADQLTLVLGTDTRTMEHLDEMSEIFAMLAGLLMGEIFGGSGLLGGGGNFSAETIDEGERDPDQFDSADGAWQEWDGSGGPGSGGTGDTVGTMQYQNFHADLRDTALATTNGATQKALVNFDMSGSVTLKIFDLGTSDASAGSNTIQSSGTLQVGGIIFIHDTGTTVPGNDIANEETLETYPVPYGVVRSFPSGTVTNPVFRTLSNTTAYGNTGTDGAHLLGPVALYVGHSNYAHIADADVDVLEEGVLEGGTITKGIGHSIHIASEIQSLQFQNASTQQDMNNYMMAKLPVSQNLRGGVTDVYRIELVQLVGGTFTAPNGQQFKIGSDSLYCSGSYQNYEGFRIDAERCSLDEVNTQYIEGNMTINDTSGAGYWWFSSRGFWDRSATVQSAYEISRAQEILKIY